MKCLRSYEWVKLLRAHLPDGKGIMGSWAKLASRAAFRKGQASYCQYKNDVGPGMWSGGIVGLKSILGVKSRNIALEIMEKLTSLGYIDYTLNPKTKKLDYRITDWVIKCSGEECMNGAVYTTEGYGFLCLPRDITERLIDNKYIFDEADAWLDLWCHTVSQDPNNAFSFLTPSVQYGKYGAVLTLEKLGLRWNWEKTKVWRFFQKHGDVFSLYRLPGAYGCLVFNMLYPTGSAITQPNREKISELLKEIKEFDTEYRHGENDHEHLNRIVTWYSRRLTQGLDSEKGAEGCRCRVALSNNILRAYFSLCGYTNCICDCTCIGVYRGQSNQQIRGPCKSVNLLNYKKEYFSYG